MIVFDPKSREQEDFVRNLLLLAILVIGPLAIFKAYVKWKEARPFLTHQDQMVLGKELLEERKSNDKRGD